MNERARLGILCTLWLLVILFVIFSAVNTLQAANNFQQQYHRTKMGDVNAIRPWMTIQVISRVYRVPEDYLCASIHLTKTDPLRKASLSTVATHQRQPVTQVIHTLQHAILVYRQEHSRIFQARMLLAVAPLIAFTGPGGNASLNVFPVDALHQYGYPALWLIVLSPLPEFLFWGISCSMPPELSQIILAAGNNGSMAARYAGQEKIHVLPFTEQIAPYMAVADVIAGRRARVLSRRRFCWRSRFWSLR